jgi:Ni,Fe-hydrogenase III small subunit
MRNEDGGQRPSARRAVAVLALETGGCGACAQSVTALQSTRYAAQLEANRIVFVESPRQADVVLLSGPFANGASQAVRRILDLVPEPQALVAIGDCAINGCVFSGSADISSSASEALDVHIELPGCPPNPSSILSAVVRAADLLAESGGEDEGSTSDTVDEDESDVDQDADVDEPEDDVDDTEDDVDDTEDEVEEAADAVETHDNSPDTDPPDEE